MVEIEDPVVPRRLDYQTLYNNGVGRIEYKCGRWVHMALPGPPRAPRAPNRNSLVVAIGGDCLRNHGTGRAAIGVFWGYGNPNNVSSALDSYPGPRTIVMSELSACCRALRDGIRIQQQRENCMPLQRLVVKSDSERVVSGVTEHMPHWIANGWRSAHGGPIPYGAFYLEIKNLIAELENEGTAVDFWFVSRRLNSDARRMARNGLRRDP
ncbi:uncharacterized protein BO97DRAFT_419566 [Aspergillus homomorphus CBS 101889]|uniref:RNase H type-1 domain-containing protein n=1 Tax=Aspergillus homomorphus (strain CBS 101889) TaxID=1450537 RepID=A0A395IDU0_ASPHC|nr:hypothetical protein BO97DRAFT_419566 [Aspergillus homomorphus CBS 101889]RAL17323.1 hypothetical protein BO97DRAFT_419566 [Aspergillus homomorphus CBS 101889]